MPSATMEDMDSGGQIFSSETEGKPAMVEDTLLSLLRPADRFELTEALLDDLERLGEPGVAPNFVELDSVADQAGVPFTADLAALLVVSLRHWYTWGADALKSAPYLTFERLQSDERTPLLRAWFTACESLAQYHDGDADERDSTIESAQGWLGINLMALHSEGSLRSTLAARSGTCGSGTSSTDPACPGERVAAQRR